jgi:hypothetical protein
MNQTEKQQLAALSLHSLPDSEIEHGSEIDTLARKAGHCSGKSWANEGNRWNLTQEEAIAELREEILAEKGAE